MGDCHENGDPLTRPTTADENAVAGHPLPQGGEGRFSIFIYSGEPKGHDVFARNDSLGAFFRSLCTHTGRPQATGEFVEKLERHTRRRLAPQKGGRKPNSKTRPEEGTLRSQRHIYSGSLDSHVIPAKLVPAKAGSGNPLVWTPAFAGVTRAGTFAFMGGSQTPGSSSET